MNPLVSSLTAAEINRAVIEVCKGHRRDTQDTVQMAGFTGACVDSVQLMEWIGLTLKQIHQLELDQEPDGRVNLCPLLLTAVCIGMEIGVELYSASRNDIKH